MTWRFYAALCVIHLTLPALLLPISYTTVFPLVAGASAGLAAAIAMEKYWKEVRR